MTQEREIQAIAALNQWGVPFLYSPLAVGAKPSLEIHDMLERLIQSGSARLRLGVTAFFLVHSEEAPGVFPTLSLLKEERCLILKYYYTAAVYLQRLWKSQLAHWGNVSLPDYFSKELRLPDPACLHGRLGLQVLGEALCGVAHESYNYGASFEALVHILQQRGKSCETSCHP